MVEYVELDRRFRSLEAGKTPELSALHSYTFGDFFSQPGLGWADLLKQRLVVVLGEPGSGKTWEFRERARDLNHKGSLAFFVRLEQLVAGTLDDAIEIGKLGNLQRWKKRNKNDAVFFLDSVDEAKFHRTIDFHTAIRRFASSAGAALQRAVIFLSCRISEWQPATDAAELSAIVQALDAPESQSRPIGGTGLIHGVSAAAFVPSQIAEKKQPTTILTVQLEPLDRARVTKFATALGIAKHEEFVAAIDKHYAWEFARRPIDVIELANFWSTHHRLGTLSEMLEHTIETNLRPSDRDKESVLSPKLAREGAMTLGAATTFCREFTFKVPDAAFVAPVALDARECLPDTWTAEQARELLTRPLFDSAAYGRIRFHHRRIAEYLTAKWIEQRVAQGYSTPELRQLLFSQTVKRLVARPAIAPVTAWLCCGAQSWHADVRVWNLQSSPEIHLQFGDPSCLPLDYRQKLLDQIVAAFAGRARVWISSSPDSLSRLAHPDLADQVSAIIRNNSVSIDLRCEMIQLAEAGTLRTCLPALLHRVADPLENLRVKYYAADAIATIGDDKTRRRLAKVAHQLYEVPSELCAPLVEATYPIVARAEEIRDLLAKSEEVDLHGIGFPYRLKSYFARVVTPQLGLELLRALVELLIRPPRLATLSDGALVSTRFTWVVRPLEPVLKSVLRLPTLTQKEADLAAEALILMGHVERHYRLLADRDAELNELTKRHPSLRRSFFWQFVERLQQQQGYKPRHVRHVFGPDEELSPLQEDFDWLLLDLRERESLEDRQVALGAAFELWVEGGRRWNGRVQLHRAVAKQQVLRSDLRARLREFRCFRPKRLWYRWIGSKIGSRWWWHRKLQSVIDFRVWIVGQWRLLTHLRLLKSGNALGWLMLLSREADKQNNSRWAPETWNDLVAKRGHIIAQATKTGCKRVWRKFWPPLPHEETEPNKTNARIVIGLTGLQAAFSDHELDFSKLDSRDATRAARYGVNELNGFAPWFPTLAKTRPQETEQVVGICIEGEWAFPAQREQVNEVLNKLVWQGKNLTFLAANKIWNLLRASDPGNVQILEYALTILLRSEIDRAQMAALAQARARNTVSDPPRCVLWLTVLLLVDGQVALAVLETLLSNNTWSDDVVVRLCSTISGDRIAGTLAVDNPSFEQPQNLRRFIPLIYRHVRPSEDIDRTGGGSYSPTARDHAQEFRGRLLELLARHDDESVPALLSQLMAEPELQHLRDWILRLIDDWQKRNADLPPWAAVDIRSFASENEIDPKTDGDLFLIAYKRIDEIRLDVEKAENSLRSELHPTYVEPELRKWLQRKLRDRARGRYTVPQEAEIDLQQRPDLRLENPRTPAVSVEVKWAQNWSIAELTAGLTTQLADQYLRAHKARYGIYVLGMIGNKNYWKNRTDNSHLSFQQLLDFLRKEATTLVSARPDIEDIAVIGIDFRTPK